MSRLFKSLSDVKKTIKARGFSKDRQTKTAEFWTNAEKTRVTLPLRESSSRSYMNMIRSAYRDAGVAYSEKERIQEDLELEKEKLTFLPGSCESVVLDGETQTFGWRFLLSDVENRTQATPLAADRTLSKSERLEIALFANRQSVNAACKRYSVKKKNVNLWRAELLENKRLHSALNTIDKKRYAIKVPKMPFAFVFEPWLKEDVRKKIIRKRCMPGFAAAPAEIRRVLPDVDLVVVKKVRYMLSQGVPVSAVASLYGLGPAVVEFLAESDTEPSGPSVENLQARVVELEDENQKLREENEALKRKLKLRT